MLPRSFAGKTGFSSVGGDWNENLLNTHIKGTSSCECLVGWKGWQGERVSEAGRQRSDGEWTEEGTRVLLSSPRPRPPSDDNQHQQ